MGVKAFSNQGPQLQFSFYAPISYACPIPDLTMLISTNSHWDSFRCTDHHCSQSNLPLWHNLQVSPDWFSTSYVHYRPLEHLELIIFIIVHWTICQKKCVLLSIDLFSIYIIHLHMSVVTGRILLCSRCWNWSCWLSERRNQTWWKLNELIKREKKKAEIW